MSDQSETSFFKRIAETAGEAIGNGIVKAIVGLLLAAGLLGGSSFINHRDARQTAHDTLWSEGGSHFYDLMTNQWALEKRIEALESKSLPTMIPTTIIFGDPKGIWVVTNQVITKSTIRTATLGLQ